MSDKEKSAIIKGIRQAFASVALEDGITLHEADVIDDYGTGSQRAEARKKDLEPYWWEVPGEKIAKFHTALFFLDPRGFRFYIPAYMTWTLENYRDTSSPSGTSTISALYPEGIEDPSSHKSKLFALLSHEQKRVIADFLRYFSQEGDEFSDKHSASNGLKRYWGQYS